YVTIPVNVAAGGAYELVLRAATPNGTKMARIEVNGVSFGDASLNVATTSFMDFTGPKIFLREGVNMITIVANWGYYDVDKIRLVPVTIPPFKLNPTLVDKAASPEAIALYRYLVANFGKVIVSGQSEEATINANAPFVYLQQLTGKLPAIRNQDMIFQSSAGGWNDGTTPRGITWHKNQKGIIAMQWHWFAPLGPTEFYTAESTFDIEKVLTPGTPEHAAALVDIDLIAAQLGQYAANRVPILWRPLHEAEGGWFWWGAKGPGPAKALYRLMFDRLVNHHGLHNLIWVWNSRNPDWYPGDDVVDVVSVDIYNPARNYSPSPGVFLDIAQLGGYKKLVALAENGPIPHPDDMVEYKTIWSWFNTWNGMFIMNDGQNEGSHVNYVYHHPKVITLDELPDLRAAPAVTAYANTGYAGTSLGLPPGDYKRQHLVTRGATGGVIRSLKIPSGYRVTVYSGDNFTGTSKVLSANTTNLSTAGFSGPVGSMRIRRY
ncbi:MAG TPA: glycosyl hydrolase, partial [Opitutus sp.]|nr:glycosyl hydrolase [Opitutus sp.]